MSENTHRQLRVLVADDSRMSAQTLGILVEVLGHEVRVAYDGMTALTLARSFVPDVIFLDIGLPVMNGYQVCEAIRNEPALRHSVLAAHTGWGLPEHHEISKAAGFDFHLVKPLDIEVLEKLFESLGADAVA